MHQSSQDIPQWRHLTYAGPRGWRLIWQDRRSLPTSVLDAGAVDLLARLLTNRRLGESSCWSQFRFFAQRIRIEFEHSKARRKRKEERQDSRHFKRLQATSSDSKIGSISNGKSSERIELDFGWACQRIEMELENMSLNLNPNLNSYSSERMNE